MKSKPTIICISANGMGAGKTTFARALRQELPTSWTMSFASPLKRLCEDVFGWDCIKDEKGRRLLQEIGVAARHYQIDFWADKAVERIEAFVDVPFVIFDDARFPNEAERFRAEGYTVLDIHVVRNFDSPPAGADHESEGYCPENTFATIPNFGTVEQLTSHAKELAQRILAKVSQCPLTDANSSVE